MFTNILHHFDGFDRPMEGAAASLREKMAQLHEDAHWQNKGDAQRGAGASLHKQGKQKMIANTRGKGSSVKQNPEHIFTQQTRDEAAVQATPTAPSSTPRTGSQERPCNPYVYFRLAIFWTYMVGYGGGPREHREATSPSTHAAVREPESLYQ